MAGIKGRHTKPEIVVRKALHAAGFRFRLHDRRLPGRPDIVLPKWHAVVQVHGCFWHRHPGCRFATTPASNKAFWFAKFEENSRRDQHNVSELRSLGWRVALVWECALKSQKRNETITSLISWFKSGLDEFVHFPNAE